nr:ABC transporter ATP-binding protein [candidate division KSB1 bacterium]NIR70905.1 ABC transporter ATP-binding protein [candidate division KSB1 bacterium]NIS23077.1 ABC transporter ATP-binding protein [candidate division KSB1 bacterium]NIT69912.1 ABC transporter ATP-binding protein [candidate division KSB1 bacterium]NIU23578.1 ABC transporter ATP-binding protein [candidate division KSB1 bacterium]
FSYHKREVLSDISLKLARGEFLGIIGPNGSGKTTLLKILNGILKPEAGRVLFNERDLGSFKRKAIAKQIALVPQILESTFDFTAGEVVLMGRYAHMENSLFEDMRDLEVAQEAMQLTDTLQFAERLFQELSGGERQRVAIASALAQNPTALFLDEPTASLDIKYQAQIFQILNRLNREKELTIVTAMHDLNLAALFCHKLIILKNGRIVACGKPALVMNKVLLEEVYDTEVETIRADENGRAFVFPKFHITE